MRALTFVVKIGVSVLTLASLAMIVYGVLLWQWWAGFGVVLLMTGIICNIGFRFGESGIEDSQKRTS